MFVDNISLGLTDNCNLACSYCFEGKKQDRNMPLKIAKKAIDWLLKNNISGPNKKLNISFFGGEPLLEINTIRLLVNYGKEQAQKKSKHIHFSATSNCTLFTDSIIDFWKENKIGLLPSADGIEIAHNVNRRYLSGKGTYNIVSKNIEKLLLSLPNCQEVRMTVTPETIEYIPKSVKYLHQLGFNSIGVFNTEEIPWSSAQLLQYKDAFYEVADYIVQVFEKGQHITIGPLHSIINSLCEKEKQLTDNYNCSYYSPENSLCGAGRGYLAVSADGTIFPCHRFLSASNFKGAYPIGNIFEGLDHSKRLLFLRMNKSALLGCDVECARCSLKGICSGGCLAVNYEVTGHIGLRPSWMRYQEIIWNDIAQSIIDYCQPDKFKSFDELYRKKQYNYI